MPSTQSDLNATRCVAWMGLYVCLGLASMGNTLPLWPVIPPFPSPNHVNDHSWLHSSMKHQEEGGIGPFLDPALRTTLAFPGCCPEIGPSSSTDIFLTHTNSWELLLVSIDPQSALLTLFMSSASPSPRGLGRRGRN